jgi:hypothetical protein
MHKGTLIAGPLMGILLGGCQSSADPNQAPGAYTYTAPTTTWRDVSSADLINMRIGMTKAQVQSILGVPDSTSAQANAEYMVYYLYLPSYVDAYFRERPYVVRLIDGKVESFGRFAELLDLYNRPVTTALPGQPGFPLPVYIPGNPLPTLAVARAITPAPPVFDLAGELETLKALKDQNVLSDEEFREAKARLLSQP